MMEIGAVIRKYRKEKERKEQGIPVPITTYEELMELAKEYDVKSPLIRLN